MHRPFEHDEFDHDECDPDRSGSSVRPHPAPAPGGWTEPPEPSRVDPSVLGALLARHGWQRRGGA
ncbi:hypothetical protein G3I45_41225, partial [Streptomyces sp. SID339]|nr:hypothetical protein [Streptomyces sp. SID339]